MFVGGGGGEARFAVSPLLILVLRTAGAWRGRCWREGMRGGKIVLRISGDGLGTGRGGWCVKYSLLVKDGVGVMQRFSANSIERELGYGQYVDEWV